MMVKHPAGTKPCVVDTKGQWWHPITLVFVDEEQAYIGSTISIIHYDCFIGIPTGPMHNCKVLEVFEDLETVEEKIKEVQARGENPDPYCWIRITEQYKE